VGIGAAISNNGTSAAVTVTIINGDAPLSPSTFEDEDEKKTCTMHRIRDNWGIGAFHEVMPKHSYPQDLEEKSDEWSPDLLRAVYDLSKSTRGRRDDVKQELEKAFKPEKIKQYNTTKAVTAIKDIRDEFEKQKSLEKPPAKAKTKIVRRVEPPKVNPMADPVSFSPIIFADSTDSIARPSRSVRPKTILPT